MASSARELAARGDLAQGPRVFAAVGGDEKLHLVDARGREPRALDGEVARARRHVRHVDHDARTAHAQRGHEAQGRDVPCLGRKAAQAGEDRVGEDAQGHRAHAPDLVPQPAEDDAAAGRPNEEDGDDRAEPFRGVVRIGVRTEQVLQRRLADEREEAHLEAVEEPAQKRGQQGHVFRGGRRRGGRGCFAHACGRHC